MSLAILFRFLCAQHVSDINISIISSLLLFCWITTLVVLFWFDVCWSFGVVGLEWYPCCRLNYVLNMFRTLIYPLSGACDYSVELPHWSYCSWFDVCWSFGVVGLEWYLCCRLQPPVQVIILVQPLPSNVVWSGHVGGNYLHRYYDLYRRLRLQFLVWLMMGAVTPETCRIALQ